MNLLPPALTASVVLAPRLLAHSFDLASIRAGDRYAAGGGLDFQRGGGLRLTNISARSIISVAYQVPAGRISGAPGWAERDLFDIVAKATGAYLSERATRKRLQALLGERCQLVVHSETKEIGGFALVVAKSGPSMKSSTMKSDRGSIAARSGMRRSSMATAGGDMKVLADQLARIVGRPVWDRTELTGRYDYKLEWVPDTDETGGQSISVALEEQVELKLESTRVRSRPW